MIIISRIELKKIQSFFKKLPKVLVKNMFLSYLGFLLVSFVIGFVIFYYYSLSVEQSFEISEDELLKFDRDTYQKVLFEWQKRNERFSQIETKEYPNPFKAQ
ncbi:MAG: hypothetical protein Q8P08_00420 [bacterium]|nr:hypothetical protein [bacterium]